jgi:phosphopantothenoylcysteine decarboxylase/phosphopantothenate--cysteine ligase
MKPVVRLVRNPDVLKSVKCPLKVGFAAETGDALAEALRKCREKGLALVVANDVTEKGSGFGTDTNRVTFVRNDGSVMRLPLMTKRRIAARIVQEVERAQKVALPGCRP